MAKLTVHVASVLLLLSDLLVGVVDVLTLAALAGAVATVGVYSPERREI